MPNTSIFLFSEKMGSCVQMVFLYTNPILNALGNLPQISGEVRHYSVIEMFLLIWAGFLKVGHISIIPVITQSCRHTKCDLATIIIICKFNHIGPTEEGCRFFWWPRHAHVRLPE